MEWINQINPGQLKNKKESWSGPINVRKVDFRARKIPNIKNIA